MSAGEQALGRAAKEYAQTWFTSSGKRFLESLGGHGKFMAEYLEKFEAFRDANKAASREIINKVFKNFPENEHQHIEDLALGRAGISPRSPDHEQAGVNLKAFRDRVIQKSRAAGITTNMPSRTGTKVRVPVVMHPEGPYVWHPEIMQPNSTMRRSAIQELQQQFGATPSMAGVMLDDAVARSFGHRSSAQIGNPELIVNTGRLPVQQRWSMWAASAAEHVSTNVYFGPNDENIASFVRSIRKMEGSVSANNVADFFDIFFREGRRAGWREGTGVKGDSAYNPKKDAEKLVNRLASYMMTSRIAIPHATQLVNTVMNEGFVNTLTGIYERVRHYDQIRDLVMDSGALEEELNKEFQINLRGGKTLFEKIFHQPGFDWIRQRQVEISAIAGKHELEEAFTRMQRGDLRAELTLKRLGVDPVQARTSGLNDTMRKQAMYNAAKNAIFFRSALNTPFHREATALGRTVFMYSHYHFNMLRTIKNAGFAAFREQGSMGLIKFFASIGILFPIAGELFTLVENGLYRKNWDNVDTPQTGNKAFDMYLNALAHASAFGIIYSMNRASRRHMMENLITGPIVTTGIDTGKDVADAIMGRKDTSGTTKRDLRPVERDILRRVPVVGATASSSLIPYDEKPTTVPHRSGRSKKPQKPDLIY